MHFFTLRLGVWGLTTMLGASSLRDLGVTYEEEGTTLEVRNGACAFVLKMERYALANQNEYESKEGRETLIFFFKALSHAPC